MNTHDKKYVPQGCLDVQFWGRALSQHVCHLGSDPCTIETEFGKHTWEHLRVKMATRDAQSTASLALSKRLSTFLTKLFKVV